MPSLHQILLVAAVVFVGIGGAAGLSIWLTRGFFYQRGYKDGRYDGIEEGYGDAIRDGWGSGNGLPVSSYPAYTTPPYFYDQPQGRFYNQAEEGS